MNPCKLVVFPLLICLLICSFPLSAAAQEPIEASAKSYLLMEASTGTVLAQRNPHESLPPASVTKIMTMLLVMEALDEGKIALTDRVSTSERAASMGGSQVYLEPGEVMTVDELLKCVAVASANDAAAALAEHVSGGIEPFVAAMNERAGQLGMTDTHFENVNGLDDTATAHYTSAYDIALMSRELLGHEKILSYTGIWMDAVRDGAFGLTNTNRLIRFYAGANGLKTGSTSKAGFCISASAERGGMQLIAVIMGAPTRDERNAAAAKLLDYGFANYEVYSHDFSQEGKTLPVRGGKENETLLTAQTVRFVLPKGTRDKVVVREELPEALTAPLLENDPVGKLSYSFEDKLLGSVTVRVASGVEKLGLLELFWRYLQSYTLF